MRFLLLLLLASGCDLVFLDEHAGSNICGPYAKPTPVPFDPALVALTQFSVVGTRALARTTAVPPKIIALAFDGTRWISDSTYQANLNNLQTGQLLDYAQLSPSGSMFAAQRAPTNMYFTVYEYTFNTTSRQWVTNSVIVGSGTAEAVLPGGTLVTGTAPDMFSYHVTTHRPTSPDGTPRNLVVEAMVPGVAGWNPEKAGGTATTTAINEKHEPSQGTIAQRRNPAGDLRPVLIYAANLRGGTASALYASRKTSGTYPLGELIAELSTDEDELEPSTNEDCSILYFRRGETIYEARRKE